MYAANSADADDGTRADGAGPLVLVHRDDVRRPRPQQVLVLLRDAEQLGDDRDGQRLGVVGDEVEAGRVRGVEQLLGELGHPRPEPLDVTAGER